MPSIKDLKKRIGTVKNTQQTTRAMKMVSAAKLRRAQEAIQSQRPYARSIGDLISRVAAMQPGKLNSPLLARDRMEEGGKKKLLLVVVTSDRGLCGGFNSNVIKGAQRWVQANRDVYESVEYAFVGRKGYEFFRGRKVTIAEYFAELGGKVSFAKAKKLSESLIETYTSGRFDEVKIIFNEFKNAVTQKVVVEDYLPLRTGAIEAKESAGEVAVDPGLYIVEPSPSAIFMDLVARNFSIQAFRILLESQASEHGARMSAMENATKNAGEMIRKLALQYNKQRQAGITKELLEIISGSESQKGSA